MSFEKKRKKNKGDSLAHAANYFHYVSLCHPSKHGKTTATEKIATKGS